MKKNRKRRTITWSLVALLGMALGFSLSQRAAPDKPPTFPCQLLQAPGHPYPSLTSEVPGDTPVNDQNSINCFAWQEFIALNWPAAKTGGGKPAKIGPEDFGRPNDWKPVV